MNVPLVNSAWLDKLDPNVRLLTRLTVFFAALIFISEIFFKSDTQFFQVFTGLFNNLAGCLLGFMKGQDDRASLQNQVKELQAKLASLTVAA